MTYQKIKELLCTAKIVKARQHGKMTTQELYDKTIEAIEKQIPKKVNNKRCFNLGGLPEAYLGYLGNCPRCNEQNANSKYCANCGQRLDWEE